MQLKSNCYKLIDKLLIEQILSKDEYLFLIQNRDLCKDYLFKKSREVTDSIYGKDIYIRGLIEFTNICKNDCYYCGIRNSNKSLERYRLSKEQILKCAENGYNLGFRTFVLQGGEDLFFTNEKMCDIVSSIKQKYPDCAITLSIGERSYESYKKLKESGADRYLLRHETCNVEHYKKLHPKQMNWDNRVECLKYLSELDYQVGCGFMVGSPYQTLADLAQELIFIKNINPQMIGIGPFIPHKDTPFKDKNPGTLELTLFMLALLRLTIPKVLLPATTALGSIEKGGRERGIQLGCNVLMPNLSPQDMRGKYNLYNNKLHTGIESAQNVEQLKQKFLELGYNIVIDRGDSKNVYRREDND